MHSLFDRYSLQARLQPALLSILPLIAMLFSVFPPFYSALAGLAGIAIGSGISFLLANFARSRGRAVEHKLFGRHCKPTARWLLYSDDNLEDGTKERHRSFFAENVPNWVAPTQLEEQESLTAATVRYDSAIRWLKEQTRNKYKFPLIFDENVQYGFRRNALGLRKVGLIVAFFSVLVTALALILNFPPSPPRLFAALTSVVVSLGLGAFWLFVVNGNWVREAADGYAQALLAACDSPHLHR